MDKLLHEIDDAAAGLFYFSEGDYPLEVIFIDDPAVEELSGALLKELFKEPINAPVGMDTFDNFFKPMLKLYADSSAEEKEIVYRFMHLKELLEEHLQNIQVFRVGEIEINVYVLGMTATGEFAGIKTKVIET